MIRRIRKSIRRGDIFYADLPAAAGSEQKGFRPVLVIQNDIGNRFSPTVITAVLTSKTERKASLPTHCLIEAQQGLKDDALVLMEQIRTLDKARLHGYVCTLDSATMSEIDKALAISVGLEK